MVVAYFGAARFLNNHVETLMCVGIALIADPRIVNNSPATIKKKGKKIIQSIETLKKQFRE